MAKRFGDLEKSALALLAGGVDPTTSQDEAVRNFWAWKINPSAASHRLPAPSKRPNDRKTDPVYLKPFALTLPASILAQVLLSKRSNTAAGDGIKAACGLEALTVGTDTALKLKGYTPARVYWRTGEAATSAPRTSRITNQPYKSYYAATDEGFSVPFGRKGADSLSARQAEIKAAIPAGVSLITFSPEKYRG